LSSWRSIVGEGERSTEFGVLLALAGWRQPVHDAVGGAVMIKMLLAHEIEIASGRRRRRPGVAQRPESA